MAKRGKNDYANSSSVSRGKDLLGRVFEYFLKQFATAEGKNGGQFYTTSCVVRTLAEMLSPDKRRVFALCCCSTDSICSMMMNAG